MNNKTSGEDSGLIRGEHNESISVQMALEVQTRCYYGWQNEPI